MYKTCGVVMLPTNEKADICLYNKRLTTRSNDPEYFDNDDERYVHQHFYVVSDEEIKELP